MFHLEGTGYMMVDPCGENSKKDAVEVLSPWKQATPSDAATMYQAQSWTEVVVQVPWLLCLCSQQSPYRRLEYRGSKIGEYQRTVYSWKLGQSVNTAGAGRLKKVLHKPCPQRSRGKTVLGTQAAQLYQRQTGGSGERRGQG